MIAHDRRDNWSAQPKSQMDLIAYFGIGQIRRCVDQTFSPTIVCPAQWLLGPMIKYLCTDADRFLRYARCLRVFGRHGIHPFAIDSLL
jgi:hypothetical protein